MTDFPQNVRTDHIELALPIRRPFDALVLLFRDLIAQEQGGEWGATKLGKSVIYMLKGRQGFWSCGSVRFQEQDSYLFSVQSYTPRQIPRCWQPPKHVSSGLRCRASYTPRQIPRYGQRPFSHQKSPLRKRLPSRRSAIRKKTSPAFLSARLMHRSPWKRRSPRSIHIDRAWLRLVPAPANTTEVLAGWTSNWLRVGIEELIATLRETEVDTETTPEPLSAESPDFRIPETRGPTKETVRRAELFQSIKVEHPDYSYARVAREASRRDKVRAGQGEKPMEYRANHVRYAYQAMGWKWERASEIR